MQSGLFGLPRSGKTTLFQALTGSAPAAGDSHLAVIDVPDERFVRLVAAFQPRKSVPANVQVMDLAGVAAGDGKGLTAQHLAKIGTADALCVVLRAFDDGSGIAPDPAHELDDLSLEMTLSDLQKVENRLERLRRQIHKLGGDERKVGEAELAVLERIEGPLGEGRPLRELDITDDEEPHVRGFQFLSLKPMLAVLNLGDGVDAASMELAVRAKLGGHTEILALNADIEAEIARLDSEEERREFMADFGVAEPARERLIQRLYALLGLITFFTVSEKEVHAWPIPEGLHAPEAAGVIHTDFQRGFIRAEVIHVDEFFAQGASLAEARRHGKVRMEGKAYVLHDGDIFHVHHS